MKKPHLNGLNQFGQVTSPLSLSVLGKGGGCDQRISQIIDEVRALKGGLCLSPAPCDNLGFICFVSLKQHPCLFTECVPLPTVHPKIEGIRSTQGGKWKVIQGLKRDGDRWEARRQNTGRVIKRWLANNILNCAWVLLPRDTPCIPRNLPVLQSITKPKKQVLLWFF